MAGGVTVGEGAGVGAPGRVEDDALAGREHLQIGHPRLRASDGGVRPGDVFDQYDGDDGWIDAQAGGEVRARQINGRGRAGARSGVGDSAAVVAGFRVGVADDDGVAGIEW